MPSTPKAHAIRRLARTIRVPGMSAGKLSQLDADLRERALWVTGVTNTRYLSVLRAMIGRIVKGDIDQEQAKQVLRAWLDRTGYTPNKPGTMQDLSSDQRLRVVIDTNAKLAEGYGRYMWQMQHRRTFPFTELYRSEQRKVPRNWPSIWAKAGGKMTAGRFIASITSRIWGKISEFGHPWPIFKFGSGMWTRMVTRARAERLGFKVDAKPGEPARLNSGVVVKMAGVDKQLARVLAGGLPGWRIDRDANLRRVMP